jgi:hypothetical protein
MAKVQSAESFDLYADKIPSHEPVIDHEEDVSSGYTPSLKWNRREK